MVLSVLTCQTRSCAIIFLLFLSHFQPSGFSVLPVLLPECGFLLQCRLRRICYWIHPQSPLSQALISFSPTATLTRCLSSAHAACFSRLTLHCLSTLIRVSPKVFLKYLSLPPYLIIFSNPLSSQTFLSSPLTPIFPIGLIII